MPVDSTINTGPQDLSNSSSKLNLLRKDTRLWHPIWLYRKVLVAFVFLFTLLWISLIILWNYDVKHNGIPIALSKSHYSWKYGPTLILTIVVSLWRQVDYHTKLLQPWEAMASRSISASRSVLLDYISTIHVKSLYMAVKNRHFAVVLSVLIFSLLNVIIFLSTGLLQSEPTSVYRQQTVTINNQFDSSNFWKATNDPSSWYDGWDYQSFYNYSWDYQGFDNWEMLYNLPSRPAFALQGLFRGSIDYPEGTRASNAFLTFDLPEDTFNATAVSAEVEVFTPDIFCETPSEVNFNLTPKSLSDRILTVTFMLNNTTCSIEYTHDDYVRSGLGSPGLQTILEFLNCSEILPNAVNTLSRDRISLGSDEEPTRRLAFIAGDITEQSFDDDYRMPRLTVAICSVEYHIERGTLNRDLTTPVPLFELSTNSSSNKSRIHGLTGQMCANIALAIVELTQFSDLQLEIQNYQGARLGLFRLMNDSLKNPEGDQRFLDPDTLRGSAQKVLESFFVQIAHDLFVLPDNTTTEGTITCFENRLHFQTMFLWPVVVLLVLVSGLAIAFLYFEPGAVLPQDPGLIGTYAAILSSSQGITRLIRPVGEMRTSEIQKWLGGTSFQTVVDHEGSFSILATEESPTLHENTPPQSNQKTELRLDPQSIGVKSREWIPSTFTCWFLLLLFLLPLFAISILEALYRVAKKNKGFFDANDTLFQSIPLYVSVGVSFTIATAFNSFDFTVASFSPYYSLFSSRDTADRNLLVNFISCMPLVSQYRTFKKRHYGATLSGVASLIGSTLTIVVSGLWIVDRSINIPIHVEARQTTVWNLSWAESATDDGGAATLLNYIQQNLSAVSVDNVWGDLIFPNWNGAALSNTLSRDDTESIALSLPALRPILHCDLIHHNTIPDQTTAGCEICISVGLGVPSDCSWVDDDDISNMMLSLNPVPGYNTIVPTWWAMVYNFPTVPWYDDSNQFFGYNLSSTLTPKRRQESIPAGSLVGCPSLGFVHLLQNGFDVHSQNATVLQCRQKIQQVQTSVVLSADEFGGVKAANLLSTPIPDETTATYLINDADNSTSFRYHVAVHLSLNLTFNRDRFLYSSFFSLITPGNFTEEFLNYESMDEYKAAVDKAYRSYMVHVINSPVFRKNATSSPDAELPVIKGTVQRKVARLNIDYRSKLVLQIMLAVMLVLEAGSVWQMNLRGVLPRKPFSIANIMGFLAGSSICELGFMPKGAEWMDKEELSKLFGDRTFGLGWWDDEPQNNEGNEIEHGTNSRFGIDIGKPCMQGFRAGRIKREKVSSSGDTSEG
ncbi:hypothetical protein F4777DRAFT_530727 [Nemania sp. FL0916]|nr:hypothetical protein F4777DRAFT_530727 [Nemania sp. FL0916]